MPRIIKQFFELIREMPPIQRAASFVVLLMVLAGFGWLVWHDKAIEFQPVALGRNFETGELASAEQALKSAGLSHFRRDGQKLMAPAKDLVRYNAALREFESVPADLGSQIIKQYETLGPFSTDRQRQQMKEALLLQELRRMIKTVPDVADAHVAIASGDRKSGWNQKVRTTANVSVQPKPGRELSATLINSLRQVVANMVPDLRPADVTIFDVSSGQAYSGEPIAESIEVVEQRRVRDLGKDYEQQFKQVLSHIPDAIISVRLAEGYGMPVAADRNSIKAVDDADQGANRSASLRDDGSYQAGFRGSSDRSRAFAPLSIQDPNASSAREDVQVTVSIPRDYIRNLVKRRRSKGETAADRIDQSFVEEEVQAQVERVVERVLPGASTNHSISVTYVDTIPSDNSETGLVPAKKPFVIGHREGIAIAVVAVCGLLMISWMTRGRPDPAVPLQATSTEIELPVETKPDMDVFAVASKPVLPVSERGTVLRDEVRSLVASDTTASATLLGQWLSEVAS